jgi:hypothetical protein
MTAMAEDFKRGDVNHDSKVDINDVVLTVSYVLGEPVTGFYVAQADTNKDNKVDIVDIVKIVDIILNGDESGGPGPIINPPVVNAKGATLTQE